MEAPIVSEPPCDDERHKTVSGYNVEGTIEFTENARSSDGTQHKWSTAYSPGACFVSDDFEYECEVILAHENRDCSWSELESMCTCYREWSEPIANQLPVFEITAHTIATPLGGFEYCRSGDLLWLHLGPLRYGSTSREDFALLRAAD
jgi:hypothetical protein